MSETRNENQTQSPDLSGAGEQGEAAQTVVEKKTFCRVCEPACGLVATVQGNQLLKLRADQDLSLIHI